MAALQSRRLAAAGHAVLQIDLFGCGDSSGDFADANWDIWKQDLRLAVQWLKSNVKGPVGLWGLRLGATLAADVARDPALGIEQLVLWQPTGNGERFMTQFLRLRLAAEMLAEGASQTGVLALRKALARGETLEIAGYDLHPRLVAGVDALKLADLVPKVKHVHWLEVAPPPDPKVSPASLAIVEKWRAGGVDARPSAVGGEPFWSTIEVTECEALLAATEESLTRGFSPASAQG